MNIGSLHINKQIFGLNKYGIFLNKQFVGTLYVERKHQEIVSFEYDKAYLQLKGAINIDPNLSFNASRQYPVGKKMFGFLEDMSPDRWGKALLKRKYNKFMSNTDYLLSVSDAFRMGALRLNIDDEFISSNEDGIPKIKNLTALINMSNNIDNEDLDISDLFDPGSSLGGARPKAGIMVNDHLYLAKFPKQDDLINIEAWENVYLALAKDCGMEIPDKRLLYIKDIKHGVLIIKRFDRENDARTPYISAMTALNHSDGEQAGSYIDLAEFCLIHGQSGDAKKVWDRLVFNILMNNFDDHLRNHGFLNKDGLWTLSPVFDINPATDKNHLSLSIDGECFLPDMELTLKLCEFFSYSKKDSEKRLEQIYQSIVLNFDKHAKDSRIATSEILMLKQHLNVFKGDTLSQVMDSLKEINQDKSLYS